MAQNSIATLAVKIVADTFGLAQGFQRGQQQTVAFARGLDNSNVRLSKFGKISADAAKSFAGLGGPGGLAFKFAGVAGPVGLAAAAVTALGVGLSRAAAAGEDFRIEKLREIGRLGPEIKTTAELMGELKEQFTNFAEITAGGVAKGLTADFRDLAKKLNELAFGNAKVAELERKNAEARKAGELAALKRRGDELVKSLRTPHEVFGDTIGELLKLKEEGFITGETLSRGALKAAEDYRELTKELNKSRREVIGGGAALEVGSQEARRFLFANRVGGSTKGSDPAVERDIAATLKRIEVIEREKKPVEFKKGSL